MTPDHGTGTEPPCVTAEPHPTPPDQGVGTLSGIIINRPGASDLLAFTREHRKGSGAIESSKREESGSGKREGANRIYSVIVLLLLQYYFYPNRFHVNS